MKYKLLYTLMLLIIQSHFMAFTGYACKIPVYRYALERWAPDLFEIFVFYDEEIPLELIDKLEQYDAETSSASNFMLYDFNINDLPSPIDLIYQSTNAQSHPWVLIRNANAPIGEVVWHGPADDNVVQHLIDSPAGNAIIQSLGQGETAAWVLLTCGNEEKDNAARELIQSELKKLESKMKLPEQDPGVPADVLKLKFSFTEASRSDPKEAFFITQLLQTEPDLISYSDEPMVFPIFGRGRVLYALIGDGINAENIKHACEFVIGACSCQVKELNPGMDLMLAANWDSFITQSIVGEWELSLARGISSDADIVMTQEDNGNSADPQFQFTAASTKINWLYVSIAIGVGFIIFINIGYIVLRQR